MNKYRKFVIGGLFAITVLTSIAPAFAKVNEYEGQHRVVASRQPSAFYSHFRFYPERKVNEYEGQH